MTNVFEFSATLSTKFSLVMRLNSLPDDSGIDCKVNVIRNIDVTPVAVESKMESKELDDSSASVAGVVYSSANEVNSNCQRIQPVYSGETKESGDTKEAIPKEILMSEYSNPSISGETNTYKEKDHALDEDKMKYYEEIERKRYAEEKEEDGQLYLASEARSVVSEVGGTAEEKKDDSDDDEESIPTEIRDIKVIKYFDRLGNLCMRFYKTILSPKEPERSELTNFDIHGRSYFSVYDVSGNVCMKFIREKFSNEMPCDFEELPTIRSAIWPPPAGLPTGPTRRI